MSIPKFILYISLLTIISCGSNNNSKEKTKVNMKIMFEVIPEENNWFYVRWEDTLGKSGGYLPDKFLKRPKEVWCHITNKNNDTLGYYHGLSMAQSFANFKTTDTIVTLNFSIGMNIFPDIFDEDTTGAKKYFEANKTPIELEPVEVNIKVELRKQFNIILHEK